MTTESNSTPAGAGDIHSGNGLQERAIPYEPSGSQARNGSEQRRLVEAERELHQTRGRVEKLSQQLREANEALIEANQELAQMPLLKHRLAEMYDQNAALKGQLHDLIGSRSWQLTEFLRKINRTLKPQR